MAADATPESLLAEINKTLGGATDAHIDWPTPLVNFLDSTNGVKGRELIAEAGLRLKTAANIFDNALLEVDGPFWWYLHSRFQRFYHGEAMRENNAPPIPDGTVIPADQVESTLQTLTSAGYIISTATGRPLDELNDALGGLGLLNYFDPARFGTLDVVREAEAQMSLSGLAKPHPLSLLRAVYPDRPLEALFDPTLQTISRPNVIMIGDSTSDILMARSAGARSVGVLTGVRGEVAQREREQLLRDAGCDAILPDITHLPQWLHDNA
jgi:phosphoglycolate phosphatase-like HAD superfamily hydrolase